jgi:hypothetical protein
MQRFFVLLVAAFAAVIVLAVPAQGANPHEVPNDPLTCVLNDNLTVTCSGSVAGLGNQPVVAQVDVAFACSTRGNDTQPGGHLQADTGPITPHNGRITFSDLTTGPADCPPGLNEDVGDTAIVSIFSLNGVLLFRQEVAIT